MLKLNDTLWQILFEAMAFLTDNVGAMLIIYSIFWGFVFTGISYFYRKRSVSFIGIFDGIYILSVFSMLKHLPLIHDRIHQALSTTSSIILSSVNYTANFNASTGLSVTKPSEIVYYLYGLSLNRLQKMDTVQPDLLYQKFYKAIKESRFFLGSYIDTKLKIDIYFILFLFVLIFTARIVMNTNQIPWFFLFLQLSCITFVIFSRNGCVLVLFFLILTRMVCTSILCSLPQESFDRTKKHIKKAKKEGR